MPVISIFNGLFCLSGPVIKQLAEKLGYTVVTDQDIVADAAKLSDMDEQKIARAFAAKASIFNSFSHERERAVAYLRLAVAKRIAAGENILLCGFCAQLAPGNIGHILDVCLIDNIKDRIVTAEESEGYAEHHALKVIHADDKDRAAWVKMVRESDDPWSPQLYDILMPVRKTGIEKSVETISEQAANEAVQITGDSNRAARDFLLAATVESVLAKHGHNVGVEAKSGRVTLTINKNVLMLQRLEEELKALATPVDGVHSVETKVGKGFHQDDIYRKVDFELPSKVLLVDDEREFVQTLSERLMLRDMGSAVIFDGESALNLMHEDAPEVMILDLKMPGIDGIEVLRRVKETNPDIEVVILTGHGSEEDRKVCMDLGAFDYLHKPVDIEKLSETLKAANEKIRSKTLVS